MNQKKKVTQKWVYFNLLFNALIMIMTFALTLKFMGFKFCRFFFSFVHPRAFRFGAIAWRRVSKSEVSDAFYVDVN